MSPTEAELRAFLHEGEGDVPDATSAISRALRVRYERRRRLNVVLSSAAVVAVVATGLTFLFTRTGDESGGSSGSAAGGLAVGGSAASAPLRHGTASGRVPDLAPVPPAKRPASGAPTGGSGGGGVAGSYSDAARSAHAAVAGVPCPMSPTSYVLPGGGGLPSYGAKQPMFARRPVGMKLCAYSLVSRNRPESKVLSTSATRTLARIIEKSAALPGPARMCPDRAADANRRIEIISADAAGRRLRPVTITFQTCGQARVTNGTSVRYLYRLPPWLQKLVAPGSPAR
jgi:hypothetical protein